MIRRASPLAESRSHTWRGDAEFSCATITKLRESASQAIWPIHFQRRVEIAFIAQSPTLTPATYISATPFGLPAAAAIITAQAQGKGDLGRLVHGFLRAVWAEERDIAEGDVVRDILSQSGFDPALADKGLLSAVETLERNTDEALRRSVFGTPSYVVGEKVFWGQDRLPLLEAHLAGMAAA